MFFSESRMTWVLGRKLGCRNQRTKENPKVKEETQPCRQVPATSRWFDFSPGLSETQRRAIIYEQAASTRIKNEKVKNDETQAYAQSPDSVSSVWSNRRCPCQHFVRQWRERE
jgi:hypothetical protein